MQNHIEVRIQKLLRDSKEPILAADHLLKDWSRGNLPWVEQEAVSYFLIHAGFYPTLINQIKNNLETENPIPWGPFSILLSQIPNQISKDIIDQFLLGISDEDKLSGIKYIKSLDSIDPRLKKLRSKLIDEEITQMSRVQQPVAFSESQKGTNELSLDEIRRFLDKKASEFNYSNKSKESTSPEPLNEEQEKLIKKFISSAKKHANEAYDIAISLKQMGFPKQGLEALSYAPESENKDWLEAELLLASRQYLMALKLTHDLEQKYSQKSETFFTSTLIKAKSFWGLNQKSIAIKTLEKLVKIKPELYDAQVLLSSWKGEHV